MPGWVIAATWLAISVPAAVVIGRRLRLLDCCPHLEAGDL